MACKYNPLNHPCSHWDLAAHIYKITTQGQVMQQNNKEKGRLQKEIKHRQYENRWQPDLKTTLLSDKRRLTLNDVKRWTKRK